MMETCGRKRNKLEKVEGLEPEKGVIGMLEWKYYFKKIRDIK